MTHKSQVWISDGLVFGWPGQLVVPVAQRQEVTQHWGRPPLAASPPGQQVVPATLQGNTSGGTCGSCKAAGAGRAPTFPPRFPRPQGHGALGRKRAQDEGVNLPKTSKLPKSIRDA